MLDKLDENLSYALGGAQFVLQQEFESYTTTAEDQDSDERDIAEAEGFSTYAYNLSMTCC